MDGHYFPQLSGEATEARRWAVIQDDSEMTKQHLARGLPASALREWSGDGAWQTSLGFIEL